VMTRDTGVLVGSLLDVYLDPESRGLAGISTIRKLKGAELVVPADEILLVGQDVVLIRSQESARPREARPGDAGIQFRELAGKPVVTRSGEVLGLLLDVELGGADNTVEALQLSGARILPVEPDELSVDPELLVVPDSSSKQIVEAAESSFGLPMVGPAPEPAALP